MSTIPEHYKRFKLLITALKREQESLVADGHLKNGREFVCISKLEQDITDASNAFEENLGNCRKEK